MKPSDNNPLTFMSFWAINDKLELSSLEAGLEELKRCGLEGVVFHPRYYPNEPLYLGNEYMDILSDLILYAKKIGMRFWIYDENGWPSGTAGGEVLARNSDLEVRWVEWDDRAEGPSVRFRSKKGVSTLDPRATAQFIEITYESYRSGLRPEAFDYITGFFTDEVAFLDGHSVSVSNGGIPWSDDMELRYRERHGEELSPLLPLLFRDGERCEEIRTRFWELATDSLVDNFYKPINEWCAKHGKKFTAHLKAEESPFFQLTYSGTCFQALRHVSVPAVDALERFAGNHFYPRIAHSIAVQFGDGDCLVEAMGGSGWGTNPEHFENYMLWLAGHGLRQFVFHLDQLRLNTKAVQDWPPSLPRHMSWKEAFSSLLRRIRERAAGLKDLKAEPELLIVTPTRGVMAAFKPQEAMGINEHDGSLQPATRSAEISRSFLALIEACHAAGIRYELTEERVLETEGVVANGSVALGKRSYRTVLPADGCKWESKDGTDFLRRLESEEVAVLSAVDWNEAFDERTVAAALETDTIRRIAVVNQTEWKAELPAYNEFPLELEALPEGGLGCDVRLSGWNDGYDGEEMELVLFDPVSAVKIDGRPMECSSRGEHYTYGIPRSELSGKRSFRVGIETLPNGETRPILFLKGAFLAKSAAPYADKDDRQWSTAGPFGLHPYESANPDDFIVSGIAFSSLPITVVKTIELSESAARATVTLTELSADAARVTIGGKDCGWCWSPDWTVQVPGGLGAGRHDVAVQAVPSTYNKFGPHHHMDGDRHLVSPAQYTGEKNFADRPEAPTHTHTREWSFVRFFLKGDLLVRGGDGL